MEITEDIKSLLEGKKVNGKIELKHVLVEGKIRMEMFCHIEKIIDDEHETHLEVPLRVKMKCPFGSECDLEFCSTHANQTESQKKIDVCGITKHG